jgi:hypothetical protein
LAISIFDSNGAAPAIQATRKAGATVFEKLLR